jgi:ATP phosphoribosyltransferase regulatory subunit
MPARWRRRLRHQFWRPQAFHALLDNFAKPPAQKKTSISAHVDAVAGHNALAAVEQRLAQLGLPLVTDRSVADIASRLAEKFADRSETPLAAAMVAMIERYLGIAGPVAEVAAKLKALGGGKTFAGAIDWFERRLAALEDQGLNPRRFHFNAGFGRELEYYTGLVFQVEVEARNQPVTVAGGGRYDELLSDLGAHTKIPAVGCAIHSERVRAVLP